MPRYQPPKDYYTATQVKEILNISGAMIANYVEKGKIKHIVPPGRKHGFYSKKDVDKLAHELQAFFDLEEEADATTFTEAKTEDIPAIIALNRELFNVKKGTDDATLAKKWKAWLKKNSEIIHVLKKDNEVIGITTVIPVSANSERFERALQGEDSILLGDTEINENDIKQYNSGNHIQLYIAEIGVKQSLNKDLRRRYGAEIISRFMDSIVDLGKRGVIIERMTSVGASKSGVKLLQHFGFSEVTSSIPDTRLFILNMEESGAPLVLAYKEGLIEAGKRTKA